jgi:hypothetical protein
VVVVSREERRGAEEGSGEMRYDNPVPIFESLSCKRGTMIYGTKERP